MKFKKICFSTKLSDLYGRDNYQSHIIEGREYWYFFEEDSDIYKKTSNNWNKIVVTYIRSGVFFYVFADAPELPECYCPLSCFMASSLVFADIYPSIDMEEYFEDSKKNSFIGEFYNELYCFDDEHTVVKDWNNSKEIELTKEKDGYLFTIASIICKKIE